jgi:hypothetical protein
LGCSCCADDFTRAEAENKDTPRWRSSTKSWRKNFSLTSKAGQRIRYSQPPVDGSPAELEIVGVVSPHRHDVLGNSPPKRLFVPLAQGYSGMTYLHVRLTTKERAAAGQISTVRQALRGVDPEMPVLKISAFSDFMEKDIGLWIVHRSGALWYFRRDRPAFGSGRRLRSESLRGGAADARDRDSYGPGRESRRCLRAHHETGALQTALP